jgi:hypothetical protein
MEFHEEWITGHRYLTFQEPDEVSLKNKRRWQKLLNKGQFTEKIGQNLKFIVIK